MGNPIILDWQVIVIYKKQDVPSRLPYRRVSGSWWVQSGRNRDSQSRIIESVQTLDKARITALFEYDNLKSRVCLRTQSPHEFKQCVGAPVGTDNHRHQG